MRSPMAPRTSEGISWGLSQFSSDENGTVPFGSETVIDLPIPSRSPLVSNPVRRFRSRRVRMSSLRVVLLVLIFWISPVLFADGSPGPLVLGDTPELLVPEKTRNESDQDRIEAMALWAAGRSHLHRGENEQALRCYQRALRSGLKSAEIVAAIVELASGLDRRAVAARYALIGAGTKGIDPMTLRRLGAYLAGEGDWASAVSLYEKAAAIRKEAKPAAADVFLAMELSRLYPLIGDNKRAADCCATVVSALEHPDDFGLDQALRKSLLGEPAETYQYLGDAFLDANRLEEARAAYKKADENRPDETVRLYNLAQINAKAGKSAEAIKYIDACSAERIAGLGVAPYELLAKVLDKLGRKNELIGRLEKLHAAEPNNLPLGYALAERLRQDGKIGRAESLYRKLLDIQPTQIGYRQSADIMRRAKRYDDLIGLLGESVENIGVMKTLEWLGQPFTDDAKSLDELLGAARKSLGRSAGKAAYGEAIAAALLALEADRHKTAGEFFDAALAADPQKADEAMMLWGVGLLSENHSARAVKVFRRAIDGAERKDQVPAFQFYLSGALALEYRVEEASEAARLAAEGNKKSPRYLGRAAWVLYYCRHNDEAAEAYRLLIGELDADHLFPETREVMREARMALSNIAARKGDFAQAEEWLEQVLDEFPGDPGALNDLGYLWIDQGSHPRRAERMIRRAVAAEPNNPAFRDSLGWALFKTGKYDEAAVELEKAAQSEPDGVILEHLGDAYLKAGKREKAADAWRKAAEKHREMKNTEKENKVKQKLLQF